MIKKWRRRRRYEDQRWRNGTNSLEKEEEAIWKMNNMMTKIGQDELDELDLESVIKELEEELDSSEVGVENKEPSER